MDLYDHVQRYQAPARAKELIEQTRPIATVGGTGSGKSALARALAETGEYEVGISTTTRDPRENNGLLEKDGVEYNFVKHGYLKSMMIAHKLVEVHYVHGNTLYGTTTTDLERIRSLGKRAVLDIDIQGVDDYLRISPVVTAAFVLPPSVDELMHRLRARASSEDEFQEKWASRRLRTIHEMEQARERPYFKYVVNGNLARAAFEVIRISNDIDGTYDDSAARTHEETIYKDLLASG